MIVITMTNCPPKLRGDMTKWMCEISTGVYVGQLSARVRDALWSRICENIKDGQATMVYSCANEQHLEFRVHNTSWKIRDFDGIKLMMHPNKPEQNTKELPMGFSKASKRLIASRAQKAVGNKRFVFLDIETTGLDAQTDDIIEIAAITANNTEIISSWNTLIKINRILDTKITELTQITDEMLKSGVELTDALNKLSEVVQGKTVVCFNRKFDIVFLQNAYQKNGMDCPISRSIDVLPIARRKVSNITNYRLGTLADHFEIPSEKRHRALADAEILYRIFLKLNEI